MLKLETLLQFIVFLITFFTNCVFIYYYKNTFEEIKILKRINKYLTTFNDSILVQCILWKI